jgi:hypothetical protein
MGTLRRTGVLAAEAIDGKSEETRVLVGVFYSDRVEFYTRPGVSSSLYAPWAGETYGQQRHPGLVCPRGLQSRCDPSAVWGCGRGRHRSLCRSGGAGASAQAGKCSSGCLQSCGVSVPSL